MSYKYGMAIIGLLDYNSFPDARLLYMYSIGTFGIYMRFALFMECLGDCNNFCCRK